MTAVSKAFTEMSRNGPGSPQADFIAAPFPSSIFGHQDDEDFWCRIHPETRQGEITPQDEKLFSNIKLQLEQEFPHLPGRQLQASIKFLKRCLNIGMNEENTPVKVLSLVQLTKWFGSFTKMEDTCIFLDQIWALMTYLLNQGAAKVSPFAGMITMEKAEEYLRPDNVKPESYLFRFSESLANRGGFSLAVKVNAIDIRHYNIVGDPSRASTNDRYNARLKLIHQGNEEHEYSNIVHFMRDRTDEEIEDGIYCTYVCPNLPLNALFNGYERTA